MRSFVATIVGCASGMAALCGLIAAEFGIVFMVDVHTANSGSVHIPLLLLAGLLLSALVATPAFLLQRNEWVQKKRYVMPALLGLAMGGLMNAGLLVVVIAPVVGKLQKMH